MKMIIRSRDDFIELKCLERVPGHLPTPGDMRLWVRVNSETFSAERIVWVAWPEYLRFLAELRDLEAKRKGSAEIEAMSPEEFRLKIFTLDCWGHPALEGFLYRNRNIGGTVFQQRLVFSFPFSGENLNQVIQDFERLPKMTENENVLD